MRCLCEFEILRIVDVAMARDVSFTAQMVFRLVAKGDMVAQRVFLPFAVDFGHFMDTASVLT